MNMSAGAPCSICLASAELAAYEIFGMGLPVSLDQVVAISSRAFLRLAAAKTTMSFCAWAMPGRNDKASARPSQFRLFNIPASVSGGRYSRLYITARPELVCSQGESAERHQQHDQQRGDQHLVGGPQPNVEVD